MVNKKKRLTEMSVDEGHSSNIPLESNIRMMVSVQNNIQSSVDVVEIKQEAYIKPDSVSVGELVEVSASTYSDIHNHSSCNEHDNEYDFDSSSLNEVKVEAKKEVDKNKENESKTSESGEEAAEYQRNQESTQQDKYDFTALEVDNVAHNTQKRGGDDHGIPPKRLKCDFCEYSAKCKSHLDRHLVKHTGEKPNACDFCPKRFTQKQYLRAHMIVHVEEFLFHCPGCLQGFDVEDVKIEHETSCKIRRYECHFCKESFGSMKANMIRHTHMHSGNKPFECKECFKQFTRKDNLNNHMKLHAGPRTFRCSNCRLLFSQEEERNTHEEKCNRPKLECDTCGKSFGLKKSNLISHMRIHSGDTPFECQSCSKQFKQKSHLNSHMATHTKNLPFKCQICRQGFFKYTQRKAHERNCNRRSYECHVCKKFIGSSKRDMERHMRTHSGDKPYQCKLCQNRFSYKMNLTSHMNCVHNKNR